ncbi:MAG TPA: hypothetical protein VN853_09095, partial [Polyangia bacterium]|nr:hypothetical protein [Polyangia bacterium]
MTKRTFSYVMVTALVLGCSGKGAVTGTGAGGSSGNAGAGSGGASAATGGTSGGAGKGGSGTGGAATGGNGTGGSATGGASAADDSVLERNHHPSRDGQYVQPAFTKSAVAGLTMETTF